jgi:hypothetical protein
MGTILTFGPYVPNLSLSPPSQTYIVTIPAGTQKGSAQLGVAHFSLIGVRNLLTLASSLLTVLPTGWSTAIPGNTEHHTQR